MKPYEVFVPEIASIENESVRLLVHDVLLRIEKANKYFFKAPASSTGLFHPACCNVHGGLLRHVKRAVAIGQHLCRAFQLSQRDTDVVIAALILHDIWKNDFKRHPSRAGSYVFETVCIDHNKHSELKSDMLDDIVKAIHHHMGPWTIGVDKKSLSNYSTTELIVFLSDYLSSRADISLGVDNCDLALDFLGEDLIK